MGVCVIAVAVGVSARFPLVLIANRDEDFDRPTLPAAFWDDAPDILGGRDALQRGSWLAVTRGGRFAAVTNLRFATRDPQKRSRGELVSGFVRGGMTPAAYVDEVAAHADEYAGFHLIAGELSGEIMLLSGGVKPLTTGVHALSNAPPGEHWPKVETAARELGELLTIDDEAELATAALQLLQSHRGTRRSENDIFIAGERYGTRSSTVIIWDGSSTTFIEQTYAPGGVRDGAPREFRFASS
jgi:uncharacterized protein with NRDE domain